LGGNALDYFLKTRGLTENIISEFELGFAPERQNFLVSYLTQKKKFKAQDVEKAGLAVRVGGRLVDRFRGRIIFPIKDFQGRTIALAGRILPDNDKKNLAKYINSPETPIYHKSKSLYGIDKARSTIKKTGVAILVEGEVDMLSSYQAGVKNVIAIKGTALTEEQVRMLARIAKSLVLALDSDFAGDSAAMRGIQLAQAQGLDLKVARSGNFKDPDEFARADPDGYKQALIDAVGVWDFMIDVICEREDISTGSGKAKASRQIVPILAQIEDKILLAHYVGVVAKRLRVPEEAVASEVGSFSRKFKVDSKQEPSKLESNKKPRRILLEERLVSLALQTNPKLLLEKEIQKLLVSPLTKKISESFIDFPRKDNFEIKVFIEKLPTELKEGLYEIVLREQMTDDVSLEDELEEVVLGLKLVDNTQKREKIAQDIQKFEEKGDQVAIEEAQKKYAELSETRKELEKQAK